MTKKIVLMPLILRRAKLWVIAFGVVFLVITLSACQSKTPMQGLNAVQIAALREQGFRLGEEGWIFDLSGKVLFGSDLDSLNRPSREIVDRIGKTLLSVGIERVRVDGHADSSGKSQYNDQLSMRRAVSVQNELVSVGLREQGIEVRGMGSRYPVVSNETSQGRTENRRVAIVVLSQ